MSHAPCGLRRPVVRRDHRAGSHGTGRDPAVHHPADHRGRRHDRHLRARRCDDRSRPANPGGDAPPCASCSGCGNATPASPKTSLVTASAPRRPQCALTSTRSTPPPSGHPPPQPRDIACSPPWTQAGSPPWTRACSRSRRPAKPHADKGYDFGHLRGWLRHRQIVPRIARRGTEPSGRLGRHRWVVERTMSWLNGCRRLHRPYERERQARARGVRSSDQSSSATSSDAQIRNSESPSVRLPGPQAT